MPQFPRLQDSREGNKSASLKHQFGVTRQISAAQCLASCFTVSDRHKTALLLMALQLRLRMHFSCFYCFPVSYVYVHVINFGCLTAPITQLNETTQTERMENETLGIETEFFQHWLVRRGVNWRGHVGFGGVITGFKLRHYGWVFERKREWTLSSAEVCS